MFGSKSHILIKLKLKFPLELFSITYIMSLILLYLQRILIKSIIKVRRKLNIDVDIKELMMLAMI